jgi:hypothetical protein
LSTTSVEFSNSAMSAPTTANRSQLGRAATGKQVILRATSRAVRRLLTLTDTLPLLTDERTEPDGHPAPTQAAAERTAPPAAGQQATPSTPTAHQERPHPTTERDEPSPDGLATENAQLHRAMETRTPIDLARGMLMASYQLSAEQAWQVLVTTSQHSHTKLHQIADTLLQTADSHTPLPEPLADHLATAVQTHTDTAR